MAGFVAMYTNIYESKDQNINDVIYEKNRGQQIVSAQQRAIIRP
jgi:hypothetical protein